MSVVSIFIGILGCFIVLFLFVRGLVLLVVIILLAVFIILVFDLLMVGYSE